MKEEKAKSFDEPLQRGRLALIERPDQLGSRRQEGGEIANGLLERRLVVLVAVVVAVVRAGYSDGSGARHWGEATVGETLVAEDDDGLQLPKGVPLRRMWSAKFCSWPN